MKSSIIALSIAASAAAAQTASADAFTDAIVNNLRDLGYDYIEIKDGTLQVKVEAVRDRRKLEVVYDRQSGMILKREEEAAEADEIGLTGVDYEFRDRIFVDVADLEDDDLEDANDDDEGEDEDDDDRSGSNSGPGGGDDDDDDEDDDDEDDEGDDDDEDDDDDDDDDDDGEDDS